MGRGLLLLITLCLADSAASAAGAPAGAFSQSECLACHEEISPALVADWRATAHAAVECAACHGARHDGAAARARQDGACTGCHGGPDASLVRSHTTAKHGVIVAIEGQRWDWRRPLADANYRAPTCAYCHVHDGDHRVGRRIARSENPAAADPARERMAAVCGDCHSPRYVATLFAAGERMVEIGRMKLREATAVVAAVDRDFGDREAGELAELHCLLTTMADTHLRNLYHGVAHQSPDYQWWYGQPALDGDLLRIKAAATRIARRAALAGSDQR